MIANLNQESTQAGAPARSSTRAGAGTIQQAEDVNHVQPPSTDRGAGNTEDLPEPLSFRPDWLGITVKDPDLRVLGSQVSNILYAGVIQGYKRRNFSNWTDIAELQPNRARGYQHIYVMPLQVKLYTTPINETYGNHLHIEIPGAALETAGIQAVKNLYQMLNGYFPGRWHHSRLDLAWDHAPFTPKIFYEAVLKGDIRTRAQRKTLRFLDSPLDPEQGQTCYLGSRQSDRMVRIYNKRGPTRVELQLRGERAKAVGRILADLPLEEWSKTGLSHLRDFLDLVDSDIESNINRAPLLDYWAAFVDQAKAACLKLQRTTLQTLNQVRDWLRRSVAPSLAVLLQGSYGDLSELLDLIEDGRTRWRKRHRVLLAAAGVREL